MKPVVSEFLRCTISNAIKKLVFRWYGKEKYREEMIEQGGYTQQFTHDIRKIFRIIHVRIGVSRGALAGN